MKTEQKSYRGLLKSDGEEDSKMRTENNGEEHDGDTTKCTVTHSISQHNR